MFDGWLNFGGVEIVNHARLTAYITEGLIPGGVTLSKDVEPCPNLGVALGDDDYRTPALDHPPWYDVERPEAQDFAGVFMLGLSGLSGTTRAVVVTDRLGDGGIPGKPRRAPRVIGASALLIGRTTASVEAGLSWLGTALAGGCSPTDICGGLDLTAFIDCPPSCSTTDPDTALIDFVIDPCDDDFITIGSATYTCDDTYGHLDVPYPDLGIDGGDVDGGDDEDLDGGGPGDPFTGSVDGGSPFSTGIYGSATLAAPVIPGGYDEVEAVWTFTVDDYPIVTIGAVTPDGTLIEQVDTSVYAPGTYTVTYRTVLPSWGDFRPAIWASTPGLERVNLTIRHRALVTVEECVAPFRRRYPNVVTVAGPVVVAEYESNCGGAKLMQVEWTMTAGDPYRYSTDRDVLDGMPSDGDDPTFKADGVQTGTFGTVTEVDTACALPNPVNVCGTNPCCTTDLPDPPMPPTVDNCFVRPLGYSRSYATLPSSVVPASNAVLSFTITNDASPKVGTRIRVHPNADPDLTIDDECAFVYEATIEYIPAHGVLTIDNVTHTISMVCDPDEPAYNAESLVRGAYDGPLAGAIIGCDESYIVTMDTPLLYPESPECDEYTGGASQGSLTWGMVLSPREG